MRISETDENTLALLKEGDLCAFNRVFNAYYKPVKRFLKMLVHCEEDAEEICQESFVKLWIYRSNIDPAKNFKSYLYKIARNECLKFLGSVKQKSIQAARYRADEFAPEADSDLIAREIYILTELAVERMPEQRKKIYRMSRIEGKKNEEIAREMNLSKTTVEHHISNALKDIREVVKF